MTGSDSSHSYTSFSSADFSPGARMMVGMAIGDAFGARFENLNRHEISLPKGPLTYQNQNRYTDDTQMAIAVAELLISGDPFTDENLALAFLHAYRRDPRPGYSPLTTSMLCGSADSAAFLHWLSDDEIRERKSDGAVMRALPLGFMTDRKKVVESAITSARITHNHPDSVAATVGVALIAHERFFRKRIFADIIRDLPRSIPNLNPSQLAYLSGIISVGLNPEVILGSYADYGVPYTESLIMLGAVMAILSICGEDPDYALRTSILFGGDTDTTAALVLGAALIHPGKDTLPNLLLTDLEDGRYGRDFLMDLGDRLSARFPIIRS
ncbi:ADP-ribosylglycohydrolase family protein [Methanospirillum sp.]|uniref:ADP-ribosylglycohydrolase family protein n=1 Tax=Methanospirillum sp. TaxID=45200 RepID=UPI002631AC4E|nr:ADP-ribosylglycohydrolase family protein [Methanospirillum sp.]